MPKQHTTRISLSLLPSAFQALIPRSIHKLEGEIWRIVHLVDKTKLHKADASIVQVSSRKVDSLQILFCYRIAVINVGSERRELVIPICLILRSVRTKVRRFHLPLTPCIYPSLLAPFPARLYTPFPWALVSVNSAASRDYIVSLAPGHT
jgi:hypothetical protein